MVALATAERLVLAFVVGPVLEVLGGILLEVLQALAIGHANRLLRSLTCLKPYPVQARPSPSVRWAGTSGTSASHSAIWHPSVRASLRLTGRVPIRPVTRAFSGPPKICEHTRCCSSGAWVSAKARRLAVPQVRCEPTVRRYPVAFPCELQHASRAVWTGASRPASTVTVSRIAAGWARAATTARSAAPPMSGSRDLFVHHSGIVSDGYRSLPEAAKVSYEEDLVP